MNLTSTVRTDVPSTSCHLRYLGCPDLRRRRQEVRQRDRQHMLHVLTTNY